MRWIATDRAGKIEGFFILFSWGFTHKNPPSLKINKHNHYMKCAQLKGFSNIPISRPSIGRLILFHSVLASPIWHLRSISSLQIWPLLLQATLGDITMHKKMLLGFLSGQNLCSKPSISTATYLFNISMGVLWISFIYNQALDWQLSTMSPNQYLLYWAVSSSSVSLISSFSPLRLSFCTS